jgi:hypothetical protein
MEICYDDTNWVERAYGHVQGIAFVFPMLDVWLLLLVMQLLSLLVCSVVT